LKAARENSVKISRRTFSAGLGAGIVASASACATGPAVHSGPIAEGYFASINGVDQWLSIRGQDVRNPVLLFLQGGPGIGAAFMAPVFADWEKDFTVVLWDQPGGGETDVRNFAMGRGALTRERFVKDGLAVAEHVLQRLGKRKLVLVGNSWGSHLGLEMIRRAPHYVAAYVGIAQLTGRRGALLGYQLALDGARARGDQVAVAALEKAGPPPYSTFETFFVRQQYTNPPGQPSSPGEAEATAALNRLFATPPPAGSSWIAAQAAGYPAGYNMGLAFLDTQRAVFAEEWTWEIRDLGRAWPVPILLVHGENDWNGPASLAREWFEEIDAPRKAFEMIPGAAHNLMPYHGELLRLVRQHTLPLVGKA
jgi:pimeloyl-ACP methyl ester carboxylesterase